MTTRFPGRLLGTAVKKSKLLLPESFGIIPQVFDPSPAIEFWNAGGMRLTTF
jgi:hypothetical protein